MTFLRKTAVAVVLLMFSAFSVSAQTDWLNGSWYNKSSLEVNAGRLEWQPREAEFYSGDKLTSSVRFVYDDLGCVVERTKCNPDGVYDEKIEQTWNGDGKLATLDAYKFENDEWVATHKYVYTYDVVFPTLLTNMAISQAGSGWATEHSGIHIERDAYGRPVVVKRYLSSPEVINFKYEFEYPDNNPQSPFITYRTYNAKNNYTEFYLNNIYSNLQWDGEWTGREFFTFVQLGSIMWLDIDGARLTHYEGRNVDRDIDLGTVDNVYTGRDVEVIVAKGDADPATSKWRHYLTDELGTGYDEASLDAEGEITYMTRCRVNELGYTTADAFYYNDPTEGIKFSDGYLFDYEMNEEGSHAVSSIRYYAGNQEPVTWKFADFVHFDRKEGSVETTLSAAPVIETLFFDLTGMPIARPSKGSLVLKVERRADGSTRATKMID